MSTGSFCIPVIYGIFLSPCFVDPNSALNEQVSVMNIDSKQDSKPAAVVEDDDDDDEDEEAIDMDGKQSAKIIAIAVGFSEGWLTRKM